MILAQCSAQRKRKRQMRCLNVSDCCGCCCVSSSNSSLFVVVVVGTKVHNRHRQASRHIHIGFSSKCKRQVFYIVTKSKWGRYEAVVWLQRRAAEHGQTIVTATDGDSMLTLLMCPSLKLCCLVQLEKKAATFNLRGGSKRLFAYQKKKNKSLSYLSQLISS